MVIVSGCHRDVTRGTSVHPYYHKWYWKLADGSLNETPDGIEKVFGSMDNSSIPWQMEGVSAQLRGGIKDKILRLWCYSRAFEGAFLRRGAGRVNLNRVWYSSDSYYWRAHKLKISPNFPTFDGPPGGPCPFFNDVWPMGSAGKSHSIFPCPPNMPILFQLQRHVHPHGKYNWLAVDIRKAKSSKKRLYWWFCWKFVRVTWKRSIQWHSDTKINWSRWSYTIHNRFTIGYNWKWHANSYTWK